MQDETLRRIASGDRGAVRDCIARHGHLVWSLARRACPTPTDAEDAVQEIFIDLWKTAGRYDPALGSESTFVATIARRRLIDRRRSASRRPGLAPIPPDLPACPGSGDGIASVDLGDEADRARRALAELTDGQRIVLTLALERHLTYDEIATATGLPLGTVKTHARRGLIRLRERLAQPEPGPTGRVDG